MNEQASCLKEPFKFTTMKYICLEEASRIKKNSQNQVKFCDNMAKVLSVIHWNKPKGQTNYASITYSFLRI